MNPSLAQTSMPIDFRFFLTDSCANEVPLSTKILRNQLLKISNFAKFCQTLTIFFSKFSPMRVPYSHMDL